MFIYPTTLSDTSHRLSKLRKLKIKYKTWPSTLLICTFDIFKKRNLELHYVLVRCMEEDVYLYTAYSTFLASAAMPNFLQQTKLHINYIPKHMYLCSCIFWTSLFLALTKTHINDNVFGIIIIYMIYIIILMYFLLLYMLSNHIILCYKT